MSVRCLAVIASLALVAAGCETSGLSFREPRPGGTERYLAEIYADAPSSNVRPTPVRLPAALAVAQLGEITPPRAMLERLREERSAFTRVDAIPAATVAQSDYSQRNTADPSGMRRQLDTLRGMAATVGADYLLVLGGTLDQSTDPTPASFLNFTIIGGYLIPADKTRAVAKASGVTLDVRTGRVVAISTAEAEGVAHAPAFAGTGRRLELFEELRDRATARLAEDVAADCRAAAASYR